MIASGQWQSLFLSHVQPFGLFWSIPFSFLSIDWAATIILVFQAAFLALPVIGLYRYFGIISALAFSFYFPLWYNALFDFHMDHLAVPILFGFFFYERKGKLPHAIFLAVLLALVKEPFALQTAFCGLYLCVVRKKHLSGLLLILFGMVYFFLATQYIQHYFNSPFIAIVGGWDPVSDSTSFGWLGKNRQEVILFIITNPYSVLLGIVGSQEKIKYVLYLFGALGFIPLLRPAILLPAIPILLISLLSNNPAHHAYNNHYTAGLIAPLIMAFSEGLPTAKKLWHKATFPNHLFMPILIGGLLTCHILISPSPLSKKFFFNTSWFYHYEVYLPSERMRMIKSAVIEYIPLNPKLIISIQNTLNLGHFSKHQNIFVFPHGAAEKMQTSNINRLNWAEFWNFLQHKKLEKIVGNPVWADYVVLDLKKPWFIGTLGFPLVGGACLENQQKFTSKFSSLVKKTAENFDSIYENDGFMILKNRSYNQSN